MSPLRPVYLVDDDAGLRNSLRFVLLNHGRDVHSFDSGEAFLAAVGKLEPGPVFLDVQMAGLDGLSVQKILVEQGHGFPLVIISGHGDIAMAVQAMKAGAVDFMAKPFAREDLLSVLEMAEATLESVDARTGQREEALQRLAALTLRENQVLNELARGHPNKTIGYDLGISSRTVEIHRANVMRKLGVHSFPDALRVAFAAGMPVALGRVEALPLAPAPQAMPNRAAELAPTDGHAGQ